MSGSSGTTFFDKFILHTPHPHKHNQVGRKEKPRHSYLLDSEQELDLAADSRPARYIQTIPLRPEPLSDSRTFPRLQTFTLPPDLHATFRPSRYLRLDNRTPLMAPALMARPGIRLDGTSLLMAGSTSMTFSEKLTFPTNLLPPLPQAQSGQKEGESGGP
jgi:hypothetical protein